MKLVPSLLLLSLALSACGVRTQPKSLSRFPTDTGTAVLFIADNQEHNLLGTPLKSMSKLSEDNLTPVAIRSPLANVGSRQLMKSAVRVGINQGAQQVIHVGDAANISCKNEFEATLAALESEAPSKWFTTLGNHDGYLSGNLIYEMTGSENSTYSQPPNEGFKGENESWKKACSKPSDPESNNILTHRDAVISYANYLKKRPGAKTSPAGQESDWTIGGVAVTCSFEQIDIPSQNFSAITRICNEAGKPTSFAGSWASYIVQSIRVDGITFLLLDTSFYLNPRLLNLVRKGQIALSQRDHGDQLLKQTERDRVVMVGHHPLDELFGDDQEWILEKASRYVSAHSHSPTALSEHALDGFLTTEMNIGSLIDHPIQAVIVRTSTTGAMGLMVRGRYPELKAEKGDFLEACEGNRERWLLDLSVYTEYTKEHYVKHLLDSLRTASQIAPKEAAMDVPSGDKAEDWLKLDELLNDVNTAEGEAASFWACQAYYAAEATLDEKSLSEKIYKKKKQKSIVELVDWHSF